MLRNKTDSQNVLERLKGQIRNETSLTQALVCSVLIAAGLRNSYMINNVKKR